MRFRPSVLVVLMMLGVPTLGAAQSTRSSRIDSLYLTGRRHLSNGEHEEAVKALEQVTRLASGSQQVADARYWQAFALYHLGGTTNLERAAHLLATLVRGDRAHHPDADALLTRVRAQLGGRIAVESASAPPCRERDAAVAAERLSGLASADPISGRMVAEAALQDPTACPELVRRTAVIIVRKGNDPGRFRVLRMAAEHDPAPLLRVDALNGLRPDTAFATLALMLRLASRPVSDVVSLTAASHLAWMRTSNVSQALAQFLADTTVPSRHRQVALSQMRFDGAVRLDRRVLRAMLLPLGGAAAQSTLLELVARHGDATDRDWIWTVVQDEAVAPVTRVTGLQQIGSTRRPAELGALFVRTSVRLVRYAVVEQLRNHSDASATPTMRKLLDAQDPGVMRDVLSAALTSRGGP